MRHCRVRQIQSKMVKSNDGRAIRWPLVLDKRNELRQIARANHFLRETHEMEDDLTGDEMALCSSQPLKAKRRLIKILESKTFQTALKKAGAMKNKIYIVEMSKSQSEIKMKIRQSHTY